MGFFSELWEFIKYATKQIYKFLKKLFNIVYMGIKFIVECIVAKIILLKNTWVGKIVEGLSFIFKLLDFLESKGADIDTRNYKDELLDMNLEHYGKHTYDIQIS